MWGGALRIPKQPRMLVRIICRRTQCCGADLWHASFHMWWFRCHRCERPAKRAASQLRACLAWNARTSYGVRVLKARFFLLKRHIAVDMMTIRAAGWIWASHAFALFSDEVNASRSSSSLGQRPNSARNCSQATMRRMSARRLGNHAVAARSGSWHLPQSAPRRIRVEPRLHLGA